MAEEGMLETLVVDRFEFHPGHELVRIVQRSRRTGVVRDEVRIENGPASGWVVPTERFVAWVARFVPAPSAPKTEEDNDG
jgi:hypothetical protein